MKKIIIVSATIPFIMHIFVFGVKDTFYLLPLWAGSTAYLFWAYYLIRQIYER